MAKRRRTTRRVATGRPGTESSPAKRTARRATRGLSAIDAAQFLSPEQQYLLRVRREAERREAKRRRTRVGVALVGIAGAATAMAWLSGWI